VPAFIAAALAMVGFCSEAVKLSGPVQSKVTVAPLGLLAVRFMELPEQTGLLLVGVTVGVGFTTTCTVPADDVQLPNLAVTLYVPAAASVTLEIEGF
jgi:hypothetical protein